MIYLTKTYEELDCWHSKKKQFPDGLKIIHLSNDGKIGLSIELYQYCYSIKNKIAFQEYPNGRVQRSCI